MILLRKIGVHSSAKILAGIMAFIGFIAGIIYSFGGAIYDVITTGSVNIGTALAFIALIGMPVTFAIPGFIAGALGAFLYNFISPWVGGIELDIEQIDISTANKMGETK